MEGNGKGGGEAPQSLANSTYSRQRRVLDPRYDQAESKMRADLAAQGFVTNSAGYDQAMSNFNQDRDRAYQDAMDAATQQGYNQANTQASLALQNKGVDNQFSLGNRSLDISQFGQDTNRMLGLGNLDLGRGQLDLSRDLGMGQLDLGRDRLGLDNRIHNLSSQLGLGQLDLQRDNFGLQQLLGVGGLQLANDQFSEQQYQNELANQLQIQNNPIQQLSMLSDMIPLPQFSPNYNLPVAQAIMGQYNAQNGQYMNQQSNNQGLWGNLAGLGGALGSAAIMASSRDFKTDKTPSEPVLDKLNRLDVEDWTYKPEFGGTRHKGPYAEDWAREFGGTGKSIDIISMMGVMMKAIQELSQKVDAYA